ncbi:MAG: hypothetical protein IJH34_09355 [Romboutsia sp.]|nr:hypothetical protein [Romboutsia sp.]
MKKIALDLEFNTVGKIQEIISVGAVVLDKDLNIVIEYESYIKLNLTKKLDPFAQKIHKIKKETLEGARDFKDVFRELIQILDLQDGDVIMTWGKNDKDSLISNAISHGCEEEFKVLIDKVQDIRYATQQKVIYKGKVIKNQLGLETLRLICGIEQQISHNALDDARCLACIYKYTHDKDKISNDKVLDAIFAEKEAKRVAKQKMLESYYKIVDAFEEKYKRGIILSELHEKAIRQIKAIVNDPKAFNNFKDLSKDKGEILINSNNYIVKDGVLTKNTICIVSIKKREMKIEFRKNNQSYYSKLLINKSTVDRAQCLVRVLDSECISF